MKDLIVMSQKSNGTYNIVKEKVGEEMFFGMVREAYTVAGLPCSTYPCTVRGLGKKVVRIVEALQAPLMGNKIHFVGEGKPGGEGYPYHIWKNLKNELIHLGQWSKDDLADALSLFYHKAIKRLPVDTKASTWEVHNTRISQPNASRINPASLSNWKVRGLPSHESSDGSLRDDPFMAQQGRTDAVGVADIRKWVQSRGGKLR